MPVEEMLQLLESRSANLRALCYPKELQVPPGFASPRQIEVGAYCSANSLIESILANDVHRDITSLSVHVCCTLLIRYQMPTYFVSESLCEALLQTEAPEDLLFSELPVPLPAMLFMLPRGFAQAYFGREVPYLVVAFPPAHYLGRTPLLIQGNPVPQVSMDHNHGATFITTMLAWEDGAPMQYDSRTPLAGTERNAAEPPKVKDLMGAGFDLYRFSRPEREKENATDSRLVVNKLTNLSVNILLGMTAEPELVTRERIIRPAKKVGNKIIRRALWKPNFIGERFRIQYEHQQPEGTHRSPHAHWRRGHWRHQRHGPHNTLVKRLWIKPVFVGLQQGFFEPGPPAGNQRKEINE